MKKTLLITQPDVLLNTLPEQLQLFPQVLYYLRRITDELSCSVCWPQGTVSNQLQATLTQLLTGEGIPLSAYPPAEGTQVWAISKGEPTAGLSHGTPVNFEACGGSWQGVYNHLKAEGRSVTHRRQTSETDITVQLNPDGTGKAQIDTGLHFFNHMLEQIARHGGFDLSITAKGDLHIDEHHTIEDTAITLGEALLLSLGNKRGLERYGFCLPMDEALAQVAVDFGGRSHLVWQAEFKREKVGDVPTEMFPHFFKSFCDAAKCNLNIQVQGNNEHHKIEAVFKAFAKALKMAVRRDVNNLSIPSTKGIL